MKSTIISISIAILVLSQVQVKAQMVYHDHEEKHAALINQSTTILPNTFQILDKEAQILNYVEVCKTIEYPSIAYQAGFEGLVQARILVNPHGKVIKYKIYGKYKELNKAVENQIEHLSFRPAQLNQEPIASWTSVKFNFTIRS